MKRIGFISKPHSAEAGELLVELAEWLCTQGTEVAVTAEDGFIPRGAKVVPEADLAQQIDVAVALGGDGTMLRAAQLVADAGVPVLGVNLGHLGFLTPFERADARAAILAALAGELEVGERARLMVTYRPSGGPVAPRPALNDAVIHQGGAARLIELEARLDGKLIAVYRVDGLIICTPSGSTAYNLAAGGPILAPGQAAMVLTPICAHALTNRPLVVPQSGTVSITLAGASTQAVLTVDGQWAQNIAAGDRIDIDARARPLRVFGSDKDYFDILREKLHWGARAEKR